MNVSEEIIIHLVPDDKFIDMAYRQFNAVAPGKNRFLVPSWNNSELRHIQETPVDIVTPWRLSQILKRGQYSGIILHSMGNHIAFLPFVPDRIPVMWIGWGFDYYSSLLSAAYPDGLLLPETRAAYFKIKHKTLRKRFACLRYSSVLNKIFQKIALNGTKDIKNVLSRVTYFSPVLESDFVATKHFNSWFNATYLDWNYGVLEDDFELLNNKQTIKRQRILIGNSATPENNHLEILEQIKQIGTLAEYEIIMPLSYGSVEYRDIVIRKGKELFGEQFKPLTEFMPLERYVELLHTCSVVVMNHLRQQGVGNIIIALQAGARLYLNDRSPVLDWFIKQGAFVYPTSQLSSDVATNHWNALMSISEVAENRNILKQRWGRSAQTKKTRVVVERLIGSGRHQLSI